MPEKSPKDRPDYSLFAILWSMGCGIVFLTMLGWWLDQKCHTRFLWTMIGIVLGIVYCVYEVWKVLKKGLYK
ncbi:MAG: AtpZ/AtpI family protein [Candidatus Omnitrophica bacterium]|nr:AtpZ/AtpI family protein [Candidatus Omnitrophota bacterium]